LRGFDPSTSNAIVDRSRETEVGDDDAVADQHVVGLEVTVDDVGRVSRGEAGTCIDERGDDLAPAASSL